MLKELRKKVKLTQKELAQKVGITASAISLYEKGDRTPSVDNMCKIADVLGCSPQTIFECFVR